MKKTYIIPAVLVVKVQSSNMLALSTTEDYADVDDGKVDMDVKEDNGWDIWDE